MRHTERQVGKYLWDAVASGAISGFALEKDDVLDPIVPELMLPEVKDPATWGGWDDALVDTQRKYIFAMSAYLQPPYYNATVVPPSLVERLGLKVMLEPQYAGKTAFHDPTVAGGGQAMAPLIRTALGDDGLKKLVVDQKAVFYAEQQPVVEAMVRGTALFAIGPPVLSLMAPYVQAGAIAKDDIRSFGNSPEVTEESIGGNCLFVVKNRPHPNAARVFVNWMLTKQVQYDLAKALDMASRRQDIPQTAAPDQVPIRGAKYIMPQREESFPELIADGKMIDDLRKSGPDRRTGCPKFSIVSANWSSINPRGPGLREWLSNLRHAMTANQFHMSIDCDDAEARAIPRPAWKYRSFTRASWAGRRCASLA